MTKTDEILTELRGLELDRDVSIISSREVGSRQLGVAHSDSDWDVMCVYVFDEPWKYPATNHSRKTTSVDAGEIDIHCWNIDKFVKHYCESNPTAVEFLMADPYRQKYDETWEKLRNDMQRNFNHMALYHHYFSMAKSNYKKYIKGGADCTLGRHFYVARALACAAHIRRDGTLPPMDARCLAEEGSMSPSLREKLRRYAKGKIAGNGGTETDDELGGLYAAEAEVEPEPTDERTNSPSGEVVNELVKVAVRNHNT